MYMMVAIQLRHLNSHNLTPDDVITGRTTEPCSASTSNPVALKYEIPGSRKAAMPPTSTSSAFKLVTEPGGDMVFAVVTDIRVSCKVQIYSSG